MSPISVKALATLAAFVTFTNAHMMMKTPIPMGKDTLNNSPLDGTGTDFPCKLRGDSTWDTSAGVNNFDAGGTYELSFIGSAVHGGGSCQVSLTTDQEPTKDSKWMVIKSIEGGCPADAEGNLPEDPNGSGAATFQYQIPSSMPAGTYTIAWTWNNKIGNREMYMNCGRAIIGGAKKKRYAPTPKTSPFKRDDFPDMFIANIGNGCTVPDNTIVAYPNPGSVLEKNNQQTGPPTGNCGSSNVASPGGGSGGSNSSSASSAPSATTAGSSQPSATGGVFATVSGSASTPSATSAASQPSQVPSQAPSQAPSPATSAPSSEGTGSSSVGGTQSGACSDEGAWACAPDGNSFQRCASGMWSAPMQMSAGTTCTPGVSSTFAMNAVGAAGKRDLHSHMSRRRHANVIS